MGWRDGLRGRCRGREGKSIFKKVPGHMWSGGAACRSGSEENEERHMHACHRV